MRRNKKMMHNLETLIIRIGKDQTRHQDQEIIQVLTEDDTTELPFELPEFFDWPTGPQSVSRKGRLLMLAGIKYMKEHYPKTADSNKIHSSRDKEVNQIAVDISSPPSPQWHQQQANPSNAKAASDDLHMRSEQQLPQTNGNSDQPRIDDEIARENQGRPATKATYDISLFQ